MAIQKKNGARSVSIMLQAALTLTLVTAANLEAMDNFADQNQGVIKKKSQLYSGLYQDALNKPQKFGQILFDKKQEAYKAILRGKIKNQTLLSKVLKSDSVTNPFVAYKLDQIDALLGAMNADSGKKIEVKKLELDAADLLYKKDMGTAFIKDLKALKKSVSDESQIGEIQISTDQNTGDFSSAVKTGLTFEKFMTDGASEEKKKDVENVFKGIAQKVFATGFFKEELDVLEVKSLADLGSDLNSDFAKKVVKAIKEQYATQGLVEKEKLKTKISLTGKNSVVRGFSMEQWVSSYLLNDSLLQAGTTLTDAGKLLVKLCKMKDLKKSDSEEGINHENIDKFKEALGDSRLELPINPKSRQRSSSFSDTSKEAIKEPTKNLSHETEDLLGKSKDSNIAKTLTSDFVKEFQAAEAARKIALEKAKTGKVAAEESVRTQNARVEEARAALVAAQEDLQDALAQQTFAAYAPAPVEQAEGGGAAGQEEVAPPELGTAAEALTSFVGQFGGDGHAVTTPLSALITKVGEVAGGDLAATSDAFSTLITEVTTPLEAWLAQKNATADGGDVAAQEISRQLTAVLETINDRITGAELADKEAAFTAATNELETMRAAHDAANTEVSKFMLGDNDDSDATAAAEIGHVTTSLETYVDLADKINAANATPTVANVEAVRDAVKALTKPTDGGGVDGASGFGGLDDSIQNLQFYEAVDAIDVDNTPFAALTVADADQKGIVGFALIKIGEQLKNMDVAELLGKGGGLGKVFQGSALGSAKKQLQEIVEDLLMVFLETETTKGGEYTLDDEVESLKKVFTNDFVKKNLEEILDQINDGNISHLEGVLSQSGKKKLAAEALKGILEATDFSGGFFVKAITGSKERKKLVDSGLKTTANSGSATDTTETVPQTSMREDGGSAVTENLSKTQKTETQKDKPELLLNSVQDEIANAYDAAIGDIFNKGKWLFDKESVAAASKNGIKNQITLLELLKNGKNDNPKVNDLLLEAQRKDRLLKDAAFLAKRYPPQQALVQQPQQQTVVQQGSSSSTSNTSNNTYTGQNNVSMTMTDAQFQQYLGEVKKTAAPITSGERAPGGPSTNNNKPVPQSIVKPSVSQKTDSSDPSVLSKTGKEVVIAVKAVDRRVRSEAQLTNYTRLGAYQAKGGRRLAARIKFAMNNPDWLDGLRDWNGYLVQQLDNLQGQESTLKTATAKRKTRNAIRNLEKMIKSVNPLLEQTRDLNVQVTDLKGKAVKSAPIPVPLTSKQKEQQRRVNTRNTKKVQTNLAVSGSKKLATG